MLRKGDIALLSVAMILVLLGFIYTKWDNNGQNKSDLIAIIKKDDKIIRSIDLSKLKKTEIISISGLYNETIIAEKDRIRFSEASCPDRTCVNSGWLTRSGDIAVCLPNKTIIKLEGNSKDSTSIDGIVK